MSPYIIVVKRGGRFLVTIDGEQVVYEEGDPAIPHVGRGQGEVDG